MNDVEKHDLMETLIANIQVYPQQQPNGQWLKSIHFKLPIVAEEEMQFGLDMRDRDETVMCFSKEESVIHHLISNGITIQSHKEAFP